MERDVPGACCEQKVRLSSQQLVLGQVMLFFFLFFFPPAPAETASQQWEILVRSVEGCKNQLCWKAGDSNRAQAGCSGCEQLGSTTSPPRGTGAGWRGMDALPGLLPAAPRAQG